MYVVAGSTDYQATVTALVAAGLSTEQVQDIVGAMAAAGANTTVTYDDTAGTVTIAAPTEGIQDIVGAMVVAGSGITVTYNDPGNTLTISATAAGANVESATISGTLAFDDDFDRANETPLSSPYSQLYSQPQYNLSSNHAVPTGSDSFALFDSGELDCTLAATFNVTSSGHSLVLSWDSGTDDWLYYQCNGGNFQFVHMNSGSVVAIISSGSGAPTSGAIVLEIVASGTSYELKSNGSTLWTGTYGTYVRTSTVHGFASSVTGNTVELVQVSAGGGSTSVDLDVTVASYWDVSIQSDGDMTLSGAVVGEAADLTVVTRQDVTGGHTLTLPAATWPGGSPATPSTGSLDVDVYRFLSVDGGVTWQATQTATDMS